MTRASSEASAAFRMRSSSGNTQTCARRDRLRRETLTISGSARRISGTVHNGWLFFRRQRAGKFRSAYGAAARIQDDYQKKNNPRWHTVEHLVRPSYSGAEKLRRMMRHGTSVIIHCPTVCVIYLPPKCAKKPRHEVTKQSRKNSSIAPATWRTRGNHRSLDCSLQAGQSIVGDPTAIVLYQ